jgi:hypothetical protein
MSSRPSYHSVAEGDGLFSKPPGQHTVHRSKRKERVFVAERIEGCMMSGYGGREILIINFDGSTEGLEDSPRITVVEKRLGNAVVVQNSGDRLRYCPR